MSLQSIQPGTTKWLTLNSRQPIQTFLASCFESTKQTMKTIIPTAAIFVSSILLASAEPVAKSHEEVGEQTAAVMIELMTGLSKITDQASANAFVATVPATKEKMKALLAAAQALPAPTEAEKATVNKTMEEAQEKAEPLIMAMMQGLAENPDAEAIGMILNQTMSDEEMNEIGNALEAIYEQEEEEEAPAKPAIE